MMLQIKAAHVKLDKRVIKESSSIYGLNSDIIHTKVHEHKYFIAALPKALCSIILHYCPLFRNNARILGNFKIPKNIPA